ncbi:MAG: VWA-like domain-containing protein [Thiotrichaceae bacterium]
MPNAIDISVIEDKLMAARTKLILDKPFLGALVLRLPLQHADPAWCATTGTDAKTFFYNAEFIAALKPSETQFILAHEALHCALSHFSRRQHRVKHRWDLACDYAINPILVAEGLMPPAGSLLMREYEDMSAEEIYPLIADNDMSDTLDQHLYDKEDQFSEGGQDTSENPLDDSKGESEPPPEQEEPNPADASSNADQPSDGESGKQEFDESAGGAPPPPPLNQQEAEELTIQWQQRLAGAAQQAQQSGKLSGILKRLVEGMLQPQLPWRMLLARYMNAVAKDDYSYTRPSSRRGDPAIYPSLKSSQVNIAIAIDVSGSVGNKEMREFISEINAIKGQVRARITLLPCDSELTEGAPFVFEPWEEVSLPKTLQGGGTTSFRPVFEWSARQDQAPDILIYFTDGYGEFPALEAHFPVIWLIKGKHPVPWGQRIQLN